MNDFKAILDVLKGFIKRCNDNDIIPCERHIETYLSICKEERFNTIFIKYCFYYWGSDDVESNLTKLLIDG